MKLRFTLALAAATIGILSVSGCDLLTDAVVPLIGLDENGNPAQTMISDDDYSAQLSTMLVSVHDSALPVLSQHDAETGSKPWLLRTVSVGIGVNAEVGIGPVKVGAVPHARLIFSNAKDPAIP